MSVISSRRLITTGSRSQTALIDELTVADDDDDDDNDNDDLDHN